MFFWRDDDFTFHQQRAQTSTGTFLPESCRLERSARERSAARERFPCFSLSSRDSKCNRLGLYCLHFLRLFLRLERDFLSCTARPTCAWERIPSAALRRPRYRSEFKANIFELVHTFFSSSLSQIEFFFSSPAHDGWCYAGSSRASVYWGNNIQYIFLFFSSVFAR